MANITERVVLDIRLGERGPQHLLHSLEPDEREAFGRAIAKAMLLSDPKKARKTLERLMGDDDGTA